MKNRRQKNKIYFQEFNYIFGIIILLFLLGGFLSIEVTQAAPQIDFSAYVSGRDGEPLGDGEYSVRFAIYTRNRTELDVYPSDSDERIWEETQVVNIKEGILKARVGSTNFLPESLDLSENEYYLGIRVGENSEMVPRKRLAMLPFSLASIYANNAQQSQLAINAQSLNGSVIGTAAGNLATLSTGGQFDAALIPKIKKLGAVSTGTWEADVIASAYIAKALVGKTYNGITITSLTNGFSLAKGTGQKLTVAGNNIILDQSLATTDSPTFSSINLTDTLDIESGGTGLDELGTANQILGVNNSAGELEYKTLTAGNNITITHGAGSVTIAAASGTTYTAGGTLLQLTGTTFSLSEGTLTNGRVCTYVAGTGLVCDTEIAGGVAYSAGSDLDLVGATFSLESTLDIVSTINLAGAGTINGLDAIDGTSETTLEGALDIAGDVTGTGLNAVTIAGTFTRDAEWNTQGEVETIWGTMLTNDSEWNTQSEVETIWGSTLATDVELAGHNHSGIYEPIISTGTANYIWGMNAAGNGKEWKQLVQGSNVTITHGVNSITIASTDTNTTYTAGNDLDLVGTQFDLESTLDIVSTINLAGTGSITGLDSIDATSETTLESTLDIAGDVTGTGLNSVTIASGFTRDTEWDSQGEVETIWGATLTNDSEWNTQSEVETIWGSTLATDVELAGHNHSGIYEPIISTGTANYIWGMNAAGNGKEWKQLVQGSNVMITHGVNSVTIAATDTNTTYTAGNDLDLVGTQFDIESQLDYVATISRDSANLTLQTTTSGDILLSPAGNVGIGTTSPGTKLEVNGVITATGGTSTNWNSAYTHSTTNTNVHGLTFTGEGDGGGLDADTLDGHDTSYFQVAGSYQTSDATLTSIATLGTAANKMIYTTGVDTWAEADLSAFGRSLLDDADNSAGRTTLGLGSMATATETNYALLAGRAGGQILIGGTGTTDDLVLQSTSGVGETGADIYFKVGNNGATTAMTILNSGYVGIGTTGPSGKLHVYNSSDSTVQQIIYQGNADWNGRIGQIVNGNTIGSIISSGGAWSVSGPTFSATKDFNGTFPTAALFIGNQYNSASEISFRFLRKAAGVTTTDGAVTELMVIDNNGNVGIGTTSPGSKLHVSGGNILLDNNYALTGKNSIGGIHNLISYTSADVIQVGPTAPTNNELRLQSGSTGGFTTIYSNGSETLRTAAGNVGIGTTSPSSKLDVAGVTTVASGDNSGRLVLGRYNATYPWSIVQLGSGSDSFRLRSTTDAELIYISNTGNVGIGTTSPGARVGINTDYTTEFPDYGFGAAAVRQLKVYDNFGGLTNPIVASYRSDDGTAFNELGVLLKAHGSTPRALAFRSGTVGTGGTETWYISMSGGAYFSGNVGIGTTNPLAKISMYEPTAIGESVGSTQLLAQFGGASTYQAHHLNVLKRTHSISGTRRSEIRLQDVIASNVNRMYLSFHENDDGGGWSRIQMGYVDSPLMTLLEGGNVGIGTTSPGYKLDVNGSINAGAVLVNGVPVSTGGSTQWGNNGSSIYYNGGNVGIGTTAPGSKLVVSTATTNWARTMDVISTDAAGKPYLFVGDGSNRGLLLGHTNNSGAANYGWISYYGLNPDSGQGLLLNSSGNVGIGTTSPSSKLSFGSLAGSAAIHLFDGTAGQRVGMGIQSSELQMFIANGNHFSFNTGGDLQASGTNELVRIQSNGNFGIGTTSPQKLLSVASSGAGNGIGLYASDGTLRGLWYTTTSSTGQGIFDLWDASNAKIRLHSAGDSFFNGGNVGIGTTSPAKQLHVQGQGTFRSDGNAEVSFLNAAGTTGYNWYHETASDLFKVARISSGTWAADYMAINNSGNVGIGTTSPVSPLSFANTASDKISLWDGTNDRYGFGIGNGELQIYAGAALATNHISFGKYDETTFTEWARIQNGNVGIGQASPLRNLHVYGASGFPEIVLESSYTAANNGRIWGFSLDNTNGKLGIRSANSNFSTSNTAMTLQPDGSVGIGTTSPGVKLDVNGTGGSNSMIRVTKDGNNFGSRIWITSGGDGIAALTDNAGADKVYLSANGISFLNGGNVGIGTVSPNGKLDVSGFGRVISSAFNYRSVAEFGGGAGSNNAILFNTGAAAGATAIRGFGIGAGSQDFFIGRFDSTGTAPPTVDFSVLSNGNVGIGTTSPALKLHSVSDAAYATDTTYAIAAGNATTPAKRVVLGYDGTVDAGIIASLQSGGAYKNLLINPNGGNVGIGTTGPAYDLDVGGGTSGYDIRGYNVYTHDGGVHSFSDARLKNINGSYTRGLAEIMNLNPIFYTYKDDNPLGIETDNKTVGFVAQELQKQIPEAVGVGQSGYLTVTTTPILYAAINAIKEQQEQIIEHGTYNTKQDQDISKLLNQDLSISEKINIIGGSLDGINLSLVNYETRLLALEEGSKKYEARIKTLEEQMELIKTQNQAVIDFATALNMETLVYKDSLGNLDLGNGKLKAEGIVAGAFSVRIADEEEKTIGSGAILPVLVDENKDGIDDETESTGKSVIILTKAVKENSKIFITAKTLTDQNLAVTQKISEKSFKVEVKNPIDEKLEFDWWIIEEELK